LTKYSRGLQDFQNDTEVKNNAKENGCCKLPGVPPREVQKRCLPGCAGLYQENTHQEAPYKMPAMDVIFVQTDEPSGPFGAKPVAEISIHGAAPALASAIHDATGVWIRELPYTPERVWHALHPSDEQNLARIPNIS
jgi:hypothetical protein